MPYTSYFLCFHSFVGILIGLFWISLDMKSYVHVHCTSQIQSIYFLTSLRKIKGKGRKGFFLEKKVAYFRRGGLQCDGLFMINKNKLE